MTDQASPGYRAASRERRTVGLAAGLVFFFLPYYSLWALIIIALDVAVVWAVAAHGRDALER